MQCSSCPHKGYLPTLCTLCSNCHSMQHSAACLTSQVGAEEAPVAGQLAQHLHPGSPGQPGCDSWGARRSQEEAGRAAPPNPPCNTQACKLASTRFSWAPTHHCRNAGGADNREQEGGVVAHRNLRNLLWLGDAHQAQLACRMGAGCSRKGCWDPYACRSHSVSSTHRCTSTVQRNTVLTLQHVAARGRLHCAPLFECARLRQLLHCRQHLSRHLLLLRADKWWGSKNGGCQMHKRALVRGGSSRTLRRHVTLGWRAAARAVS